MSENWYLNRDGRTNLGPFTPDQLRQMAIEGRVVPTDKLWRTGEPTWIDASTLPYLTFPPPLPSVMPPIPDVNPARRHVDRLGAGLCGIFLGAFGVHKFMMGYRDAGKTMLLVTVCSCFFGSLVMGPIGFIEGLIYLTKSDEEFQRIYVEGHKAWF